MGSSADHGGAAGGRGKKQAGSQLWKKALLHSSLCFVMGFFTGFAPSSVSDWTSAAGRVGSSHVVLATASAGPGAASNRSLLGRDPTTGLPLAHDSSSPRPLLVVVTTTESTPAAPAGDRAAALTRMAHTLRLVPPPLLWVVVEAAPDVPATARLLRATGLMYRHLTYRDNFTAADAERHHQRNVALGHVEHHRLAGVVLFAGLGDVFDLGFFDQLREISAFGAWPVATLWRDGRKVVVRGPACSSSAVTGWFSQDFGSGSGTAPATTSTTARPAGEVDVHGFAFNSSVLWDPERWGRYPTSEPDKSQDSMKFVQQVVLEDFSKVKGIPSDCSEVMVWHVDTAAPSPSQPSMQNKRR